MQKFLTFFSLQKFLTFFSAKNMSPHDFMLTRRLTDLLTNDFVQLNDALINRALEITEMYFPL